MTTPSPAQEYRFLIAKNIIDVVDFPQKGVVFKDISPVLQDPKLFEIALNLMLAPLNLDGVTAFAGIESRGFILGAALAGKTGLGFIPIRKSGKLPPPVIAQSYALEYGTATLEIKEAKGRVVLIDDVLATGGTLQAAIDLCQKAGLEVHDISVLIDLRFLNQFRYRGREAHSALQY